MQNILIISNDSRIPSLVDFFQPLVRAQVHSVADFDLGLKEVFDKRPVAVFIQSEIAGISGDAVAKHVKGLLRDDSPRLVLLRDAPDKPLASRHAFDDSIDLFLPLEEVVRLTRGQLEKIAGLEFLEAAAPSAVPEPAAEATEKVRPVPQPAAGDLPATAPKEPLPPAAQPRPAAAKPATPPAATSTAVKQDSARQEQRVSTPKAAAPTPPAGGTGAVPPPPAFEAPLYEPEFKPRPSTSRIWLYLCILLALVLGGAFFFAPRWFGVKKHPPAPVTQTPPAPSAPPAAGPAGRAGRAIPSVVPLNGRDAAYASGHPGWERYESPTLEFLVYKERGTLKAIQVIGRTGGSVPEQTVAALLRESFQTERYTVKSVTEKDGFQLEEGTVPGKGEILLYRKKGPGTVRAVVITWP